MSARASRLRRVVSALAAAGVAGLVAAGAVPAQDRVAPRLVSPAKQASVKRGVPFTFKASAPAGVSVFVIVSKSKARAADGTLRDRSTWFRKMGRQGGRYVKRVERYAALPDHFLNRPGRWYWQAFAIDCVADSDCAVESETRAFRVR